MSENIVEIKNLSKQFGTMSALDKVSIDIPSKSIFGILGPNGSGKSTLMRIISGLIKKWDGEIKILGEHVHSSNTNYLNRLGFMIESPSFYEYLSAKENLKIFARLTNNTTSHINHVLERVNLINRAKDKVKTYSYGMKQRLGLAQCLLHDPKILILDEPNNGLDPSGIREMSKIINSLHKSGKTIRISTHILSEVESLCTNVAVLKNGQLMSTVKLNDEFFHKNSFIINSKNISDCKDLLQDKKLIHALQIDEHNMFIQSKDRSYLKAVKKTLSNANIEFSITKESNLMYYFND